MFSVPKNSENEMVIKQINNIFFFERKKKQVFCLAYLRWFEKILSLNFMKNNKYRKKNHYYLLFF